MPYTMFVSANHFLYSTHHQCQNKLRTTFSFPFQREDENENENANIEAANNNAAFTNNFLNHMREGSKISKEKIKVSLNGIKSFEYNFPFLPNPLRQVLIFVYLYFIHQ